MDDLTESQYRVGISFNPGRLTTVSNIKIMAAELIDYVLKHGKNDLCSDNACREFESAAMWAVKSVTKEPR